LNLFCGDEQHGAIAIALQRPPLAGNELSQPIQILGLMQHQLHLAQHPHSTQKRESGARRSQV